MKFYPRLMKFFIIALVMSFAARAYFAFESVHAKKTENNILESLEEIISEQFAR